MRPCIVIHHSFDPDVVVYEYDSDDEAIKAVDRLWKSYLAEERSNNSELDESNTWTDEEGYAKITWSDGCVTTFVLSYIGKEESK